MRWRNCNNCRRSYLSFAFALDDARTIEPTHSAKMKRSTTTSITLVALTALAACATPAEGKFTSLKKYRETHSREEFVNLLEAKTGKKRVRPPLRDHSGSQPGNSNASGERGRSLAVYAYCEDYNHCDTSIGYYSYNQWWDYNVWVSEWCDGEERRASASATQTQYVGRCTRNCGNDDDCGTGAFCDQPFGQCRSCREYAYWNSNQGSTCGTCTSDSDCATDTFCAHPDYTYDQNNYYLSHGYCATCHDCFDYNTYDGNSCTACSTFLTNHANAHNFASNDVRGEAEAYSLTQLPSECWRDASKEGYDELYVGDCGAFGEETELWCEGFCIADSWFDCCDPKAGAIAALTMGCFFAFVGALFTAAWIFNCWCFKKPNALMLQAMANQQQQRAMAAGHMQSPVVVQMQAPVAK